MRLPPGDHGNSSAEKPRRLVGANHSRVGQLAWHREPSSFATAFIRSRPCHCASLSIFRLRARPGVGHIGCMPHSWFYVWPITTVVAVLNTNDDLLELVRVSLEQAGFVVVSAHIDDLRRGTLDLPNFLRQH